MGDMILVYNKENYLPVSKGTYFILSGEEKAFELNSSIRDGMTNGDEKNRENSFVLDSRSFCEILFNTDWCREQMENGKNYIYTESIIRNPEPTRQKVVITYANVGFYNIWLNNVLMTALPYSKNDEDATIAYLEPGDNYLVSRLDIEKSTIGYSLRINIYNYDYAKSGDNEYIQCLVNSKEQSKVKLVFDYQDNQVSQYMLVQNDLTSENSPQYLCKFKGVYNGKIKENKVVSVYEPTVFPSATIQNEKDGDSELYEFSIIYNGESLINNLVLLHAMRQELSYLTHLLKKHKLLNEPFVYEIREKIKTLSRCLPLYINYCFYSASLYLYELKSIYHLLKYGYDKDYYKIPSLHHFRSNLDERDEQIAVYIPYGYDNNEQSCEYALCILATTGPDHYAMFERYPELRRCYKDKPIIFASITCKGVTTGSYIGEAAFLECYNELQSLFLIDKNKVFLHGTSNGAYATWALAEAYPHLFAAISPISGLPIKSELGNLNNIYIYNVHENSENGLDLYSSFDYPNYFFDMNVFSFDTMQYERETHTDLYKLILHPSIIDHLIDQTRRPYPEQIHYITENGMHSEAYYISIRDVSTDAMEAHVDSDIQICGEEATWRITTENIYVLSIQVPPYLKDKKIRLFLNEAFIICNYSGTKLINLDCKNLVMTETCMAQNKLWNSGIVSCYFGPLRILIPNKNSTDHEESLQIANNLSSPRTNGYIRRMDIIYPIYEEKNITIELLKNSNWIIIGQTFSDKSIQQMCWTPLIKNLKNKFAYNGEEHSGEYSVLYSIVNFYNPQKVVTRIAFSSLREAKKNLFLRNMILPSASNGFHPYLNQNVLIRKRNDFYCAKNYGDPLITVSKFIGHHTDRRKNEDVVWDMANYDDAISLIATNIEKKKIENGIWSGKGWRGDPNLTAINKEINADKLKCVIIDYENKSTGTVAQLFFSKTSRYDFCESESVFFPVTPNDNCIRRYMIDLSQNPNWNGKIRAIRFDPFSYDCDEGYFKLLKIKFIHG